jgi:hypothetical protein
MFTILLCSAGAGSPAFGQAVCSVPQDVSPPGSQNGYLGLDVAMNQSHLAMGAPWRFVNGERAAGAVEITASDGSPLFTLDNPNAEANAYFGIALALNDSVLAVGASHADYTGTDSGVVYRFDLAGQSIGLPIVNPGTSRFFGRELALNAKDELTVSAIGYPGAIYRFDSSGFQIAPTIINPAPGTYPYFATALAVTRQGDILTTGISIFPFRAVVYRFAADGTLLASTAVPNVYGLFLAAMVNGDALVGVVGPAGNFAVRLDALGDEVVRYVPPAGGPGLFGSAVEQLGDTVAVGSPARGGGVVYLFDAASGTLACSITADPSSTVSEFGASLSAQGDGLLIGAPASYSNDPTLPSVHLLAL